MNQNKERGSGEMSNKPDEQNEFRWIEDPDTVGEMCFTFDGERVFNLFRDYPHELTPEEKEIFDSKNPYWAEFFKDRV